VSNADDGEKNSEKRLKRMEKLDDGRQKIEKDGGRNKKIGDGERRKKKNSVTTIDRRKNPKPTIGGRIIPNTTIDRAKTSIITIDGAKITNPTIDLVKISKISTVHARNSITSIGEIKNLIGGIRNSTSLKETLVDGGEAVKRSSK
jgi:hypothetical protein